MVYRDDGDGDYNPASHEFPLSSAVVTQPGILFLGTFSFHSSSLSLSAPAIAHITNQYSCSCQILDIVLFSVFSFWFALRYIWFPSLFKATLEDFSQSNYLGAIPIAFDTIISGLVIFYSADRTAVWVAYGFWWVAVGMTLSVGVVAVFWMFVKQPQHKLEAITGV